MDRGVQFITPAGPRQSFLFSQGPQPTFVKTLYTLSVRAQAHIPKFLKPSLESVKGRYNQVTAMIHNQKCQLVIRCSLHQWVGEGDGTHSSTLAWKIPWMEEPGRLQSMGLQRVRHD